MLPAIVWSGSPEIFHVDALNWGLRYYSLLFMSAVLGGYYLFVYFCKKDNITQINFDSLFMHVFLGIIIGARLGHVLFYDPVGYLSNPIEILKVWKGGLASHGAIVGIGFGVWLYCRKYNVSLAIVSDLMSISITFAFLIRVGNFFNSEIIGTPSDLPWAVVFERIDSIPRHPAQLYEAIFYAGILLLLVVLYRVFKVIKPGSFNIIGTALVLVFSARLYLEQFKENQAGFESGLFLNMGQILSVPLILLGLYALFVYKSPSIPAPEMSPKELKPAKDEKRPQPQGSGYSKKKHKKKK